MGVGGIGIVLAALATTGCSGGYFSPQARHLTPQQSATLTAVKIGMTRDEVIQLLGSPHRQEIIGKTELLTYRPCVREHAAAYFSPVGIVDGRVVGFGPNFEFKIKQEQQTTSAAGR